VNDAFDLDDYYMGDDEIAAAVERRAGIDSRNAARDRAARNRAGSYSGTSGVSSADFDDFPDIDEPTMNTNNTRYAGPKNSAQDMNFKWETYDDFSDEEVARMNRVAGNQKSQEEVARAKLGHATELKGSGYNLTDDALDDMAKKLGIDDAQASVIKQKYKAKYSYNNLQSNIDSVASGIQGKIDDIKSSGPKMIQEAEAAMKGLDANSADYKKLAAKIEGLKGGTGALEGSLDRLKSKGGDALSRQKGVLGDAVNAFDDVKKVVGSSIDKVDKQFTKAMDKQIRGGAFSVKNVGGKLLVGAAVTYGLVQLLNDNKGRQENSQLYSPGGPMY
jgi:hypothetical protein